MIIKSDNNIGFNIKEAAEMLLTNSIAETTLFQYTVKGGDMSTSKVLEFEALCALTTVLTLPLGFGLTVKVKLGTGSLTLLSNISLSLLMTNKPFRISGKIANRKYLDGSNSQFIFAQIMQNASGALVLSQPTIEMANWSLNLANDQDFKITAQFGILSANATLTRKNAFLEIK